MWWVIFSSHIALEENLGVRPLLKVGRPVAVEAQSWSLGQGATLGALGRLEGDEVLAPRVFGMTDSKKVAKGARAA